MEMTQDLEPELELVRRISERVLGELNLDAVELEVSLGMLEPLIELAAGGEVVPVDLSDPAGGFGGVDLLVVTVVPAVFWVVEEVCKEREGALDARLRRALSKVETAARRTGSPRAEDRLAELEGTIRKAALEILADDQYKT